jgi:hypothetical protein
MKEFRDFNPEFVEIIKYALKEGWFGDKEGEKKEII